MALQQTAHDACSRRVHCVAKGYLDDPYVAFFVKDSTIVNSPLMNRGSWLRATAFENMVYRFSAIHQGAPIQVVSLGAGVDTLYFRLKRANKVAVAKYVEIDLPDLILEKSTVVRSANELAALADDSYVLAPIDLQDTEGVMNHLSQVLNPSLPTLLIAECVFVYIDSPFIESLLHRMLTELFTGDVMLVNYDVIEPRDRFGTMMAANLKERGIVLHGIDGAPTLAAHAERSKRVGFTSCRAVSMRTLYLGVPKATQLKLNKIEMIDDWDEWNLVHDHYAFVISWKGGDGTGSCIPPVFIAE